MSRWLDDPLLSVEGLTMRFGGLTAVSDFHMRVGRGDITALIGPNGAGKTTVFNCITGFYKPTQGRLALAHAGAASPHDVHAASPHDVDAASPHDVDALTRSGRRFSRMGGRDLFLLERMADHEIAARARVARTFQNIRLFAGMTVLENLIVAQHNALMRASGLTLFGLLNTTGHQRAEAAAVARAVGWLERINLIDRADDPAGALPYGDQRRLEIARAMCVDPVLLCLDEPAAGLNPRESAQLTALLRSIRDDNGVSVLLIEHDMSVVMQVSDHVVVLDYGRKIADGAPQEVREDPRVIAAYLGVDDEAEVIAAESEIARLAGEAP